MTDIYNRIVEAGAAKLGLTVDKVSLRVSEPSKGHWAAQIASKVDDRVSDAGTGRTADDALESLESALAPTSQATAALTVASRGEA